MHRGNRMGGGGAQLWFTAVARKRAMCFAGEESVSQGGHTHVACALEAAELLACIEEYGLNRCSGRAAVAEVAGQLHCPVIIRCCRRVQQSLGPALLKFSSLHPVLKHGSRSLAVWRVFWCQTMMRNESKQGRGRRERAPAFPAGIWFFWRFSAKFVLLVPERWWAMPESGEASWKWGGGPTSCWRANRWLNFGIGAKYLSNHLVAGFFRSFPQDSCLKIWVACGRAND